MIQVILNDFTKIQQILPLSSNLNCVSSYAYPNVQNFNPEFLSIRLDFHAEFLMEFYLFWNCFEYTNFQLL